MKISFVCQWGESSTELLDRYKKQTPNNSGRWEDIEAITDVDSAEVVVGLGNSHFGQREAPRLVHLRREPDFIQSFNPTPNAKYVADYPVWNGATWWIERSFNELMEMPYPQKNKKLSAISSSKWKHRNNFLSSISDLLTGEDVDFYGYGISGIVDSERYKGTLPDKAKFNGLYDYSYSIAIENSSQEGYWTEKIADCFLAWTIPIYWGCPNIFEFFPEDSYYNINISRPEDIKEILKMPVKKKNVDALREARYLVLNKYNLWPVIANILKKK